MPGAVEALAPAAPVGNGIGGVPGHGSLHPGVLNEIGALAALLGHGGHAASRPFAGVNAGGMEQGVRRPGHHLAARAAGIY